MYCYRLEDLSASIEAADGMLEDLHQLEASSSPAACFQLLGLTPAVLTGTEADTNNSNTVSEAACMAYIRKALPQ